MSRHDRGPGRNAAGRARRQRHAHLIHGIERGVWVAVPGAERSALSRVLGLEDFNLTEWITSPAYIAIGYPAEAYRLVLAYWFVEGEPERMDVDGNGIPCELLFEPEDVAEVWAGEP